MTRDPDRMEPLLAALLATWRQQPDLRLTQLLWRYAAGPDETAPAFFYTEDDQLLVRLTRDAYDAEAAAWDRASAEDYTATLTPEEESEGPI